MEAKINYKITFSRNGYVRNDGTREVVITCSQCGKTIQIGTKIYIENKHLKNGFIQGHPLSDEYNRYVYKLKNDFERLEIDLALVANTSHYQRSEDK